MIKENLIPIEQILLEEIEKKEQINPNCYYSAKQASIKIAQDMGISDDQIEKLLNIKIKPEDRQ